MKKYIIIISLIITYVTYSMKENTTTLNTIVPSLQKPAHTKQEKTVNIKKGLTILDDITKYSGLREEPIIKLQSRLFVANPKQKAISKPVITLPAKISKL